MKDSANSWNSALQGIKSLRLAASDLNGQARGKRIPIAHAEKAISAGARMPKSALNVDIWGDDIENSPLVFASGDQDGVLRPTHRGPVPLPWMAEPAALLPLWMFHDDDTPFAGDPRQALQSVLERYAEKGWTPVVAMEMEFYLIDDSAALPAAPASQATGKKLATRDVLSLSGLDSFEPFFNDLYDACAAMDIPADAAISEGGLGQFEINLLHGSDPLKAADDAWLFKMATKGVARKHGIGATFMGKPFDDQPGNGLHIHFSVLDKNNKNIFDDGSDEGSEQMKYAVCGLLKAMRPSTLIFSPSFNAYRRIENNSHAPTSVNWGYENRTAGIRIPGGPAGARRIEHRLASGDANPYLILAAVLGAAFNGIEQRNNPPVPTTGNTYDQNYETLPGDWATAIDLFEHSPEIASIFDAQMISNFVACKRQELAVFNDKSREFEMATYMETL